MAASEYRERIVWVARRATHLLEHASNALKRWYLLVEALDLTRTIPNIGRAEADAIVGFASDSAKIWDGAYRFFNTFRNCGPGPIVCVFNAPTDKGSHPFSPSLRLVDVLTYATSICRQMSKQTPAAAEDLMVLPAHSLSWTFYEKGTDLRRAPASLADSLSIPDIDCGSISHADCARVIGFLAERRLAGKSTFLILQGSPEEMESSLPVALASFLFANAIRAKFPSLPCSPEIMVSKIMECASFVTSQRRISQAKSVFETLASDPEYFVRPEVTLSETERSIEIDLMIPEDPSWGQSFPSLLEERERQKRRVEELANNLLLHFERNIGSNEKT